MKHTFGVATAFAIVVGSMVGTGVFTSLGYQLAEFESGFVLMALWVLGGVCAFCGAVCYCELAAAIPRSGGEYNFLGSTFHPAVGFVAGWVSFTIGFSAPAALVALTFGEYLAATFSWINPKLAGVVLILVVTAINAHSHRSSGGFQSSLTFMKIALVTLFCVAAWALASEFQDISFAPAPGELTLMTTGGFAVSLIYVNYAYAGWNATTYVIEELDDSTQTINRALMLGTGCVLILYLMLNATFLLVAPIDAMKNKVEVGFVAAFHAFGDIGARVMSLTIAFGLMSTLSAMVLAGPRVLWRIGGDYPALKGLAKTNANGMPIVAIFSQSGLALILILTGTFESILLFAGLLLGVSTFATVCAAVWRRHRFGAPSRYRMPLYPLPAAIYLLVTGATIVYAAQERIVEGVFAVGMIAVGGGLYVIVRLIENKRGLKTS